jgi:hypothetical protein
MDLIRFGQTMLTKQFKGFNIRVRETDGYIHASDMCKVSGKKKWAHYMENKSTKEFLYELSISLETSTSILIQSKMGGNAETRGTWVHPRIATHLAQWISPEFAVKITGWIEQWKYIDSKNNEEYMNHLSNLKPSVSNQKEREVQLKLQAELNAEIEVKNKYGYIDLITDTDIIEIKAADKWKHALGQILAYSVEYPDHQKWIYLFDGEFDADIVQLCRKFDVNVKYL